MKKRERIRLGKEEGNQEKGGVGWWGSARMSPPPSLLNATSVSRPVLPPPTPQPPGSLF